MDAAHDLEALAKRVESLPAGAKRAFMLMTDDWQFPGRTTFTAGGAWSLHYAKGFGGRGTLCEYEMIPHGKHKRAAYRLSELGLALRALSQGVNDDHA